MAKRRGVADNYRLLRSVNRMPGFSLRTNLDAEEALKAAKRAAKQLDYTVAELDDWELSVQKGNLAASIFVGAFVAYCDFRVTVESRRDGTVEIVLERNTPWWTGIIGVNRVKSRAKELADEIEADVLDRKGEILKRDTF
jgi:hypothetical protein